MHSLKKILSLSIAIVLSTALFFLAFSLLLSPSLPEEGSPPRLYSLHTGDDITITYSGAFASAKESILIIVFSFTDDSLAACLRARAAEGIPVTVVTDKRNAAAAAKILGPDIITISRVMPGLMHQKIVVIDEAMVFIGSANMTTESLRMHDNIVVGVNSPSLADTIISRTVAFTMPPVRIPYTLRHHIIGSQDVEYFSLPEDREEAFTTIIDLINSATTTIKIAMFTWTHPVLAEAVIAAKDRGVDVEIIVDYSSSRGAGKKIVATLRDADLDVLTNQGPSLLHHKFLLVDNTTLVNGSLNWTKAAFKDNDECFLVINNLSTQQQLFMQKLWKNTTLETR